MGPLDGIRVLDLSRLAPGPYCSMVLADFGANVVRVDHPGGEVRSGDMLSRNKRAIAIDLKQPQGQQVLHRLCESADVLLEGNRPGVTHRLGCDYETIAAINPAIVYCSLTGYGQEGPLAGAAGHDIDYIAIAGALSQFGTGKDRPVPPVNLLADFAGGGLTAAFGILAALLERTRSGRGQYIDAAMIDGAASLMAAHYATGGRRSKPGVGVLGGAAPFYRCYECRDGKYVAVGAIEPKFFAALCAGTGLELAEEQHDEARWPEMSERFAARFLEKTRDEWIETFRELDACVAPVLELDEAPEHEHNRARRLFFTSEEGVFHVAPAPRLARTPATLRREEPAGMGAHTDEILAEAGLDDADIERLRTAGAVV
jgi:alpha-methylacyl-CoA racemase